MAEMLGTCFLVYLGCGAVMTNTVIREPSSGFAGSATPETLPIALSFGFAAYVIIYAIGGISGGHINPAISTGFLVVGKMSVMEWAFYVLAQMLGGIIGAALLAISHGGGHFYIANTCNAVPTSMSVDQAFFIEFFLTAILTFAVFAVVDPSNRTSQSKTSPPHVVGMVIAVCHLVAVQTTGTSVNPARSFGPAVVAGLDEIQFSNPKKTCWQDHWVFWIAPTFGAIASALLYNYYFDGGLKGTTSNITRSDVDTTRVIKVKTQEESDSADVTPMLANTDKDTKSGGSRSSDEENDDGDDDDKTV